MRRLPCLLMFCFSITHFAADRPLVMREGSLRPAWLRGAVHERAQLDTWNYIYEVYESLEGRGWLVRFVQLPEGSEKVRQMEQVFWVQGDHQIKVLAAKEIEFNPEDARTTKLGAFSLSERWELEQGKAERPSRK
jgi:hypothetical protein